MIYKLVRRFFANIFYPTQSGDWYKIKKYKGVDHKERFADFISCQRSKGSIFYKEIESLQFTRQFIMSGDKKLDSVLVMPDQDIAKNKPGFGLYFIMFQGRLESYEKRFRDMAMQARETGACVLGFNPKGFFCSEGKTNCLSDMVEDGIAVVDFLLQRGVHHNCIILQGNSLGAAVQEMVSEHYIATKGYAFRQINSNSFKNLGVVFAYYSKLPFCENLFSKILRYLGWEFTPGPNFYRTGPYRFHFRRFGDRTIALAAEYHTMIDFQDDNKHCPKNYKETHKWLYEHNQLVYRGSSKKDPHKLSLHFFQVQDKESGKYISVYDVINRYLTHVNSEIKRLNAI